MRYHEWSNVSHSRALDEVAALLAERDALREALELQTRRIDSLLDFGGPPDPEKVRAAVREGMSALAESGAKESGENDAASGGEAQTAGVRTVQPQAATPDSITLHREALRALVERAVRAGSEASRTGRMGEARAPRIAARVLAEWRKP